MHLLSVLNQINGRDKTARFAQYLSRALWYVNDKEGYVSAEKYKAIEYQLSTFRKMLRFGRCLESFSYASQSFHQEDLIIRLKGFVKIANGCFLFCDHLLLMNRLNLLNLNLNEWTFTANRYWFLTDILNLVQNYYELKNIYNSTCSKKENCSNKYSSESMKLLLFVYLDIFRNLCDIFLPLCTLNTVKLNPGIIGILGMISSLVGFILLMNPR